MRNRLLTLIMSLALVTATGVAATASDVGARDPVGRFLARMSLPEKVGQLFVTQVYGADATAPSTADAAANRQAYGVDTPAEVVARYHLGGVIYFAWSHNLDAPRQIATLSNGLQHAATTSGSRMPLLISTDQEHGVVTRLPAPATQFPGSMALGAARSPAHAFTAAAITGRELRAVGIVQPWAPVADVNVNPANPVIGVRSFGGDPRLAAGLTAAQVTGFQQGADASAAAKHFPGHGDTATDSHTGLPVIEHTREQWQRLDAPPFRAAIAAGVDTIMSAHIVVPALDPSGDPATLSPRILTGLLRQELGFPGVVVTDSLSMAGVREKYGDDRVPVLALKAGADLLLMPPDLDLAYRSVLDAVRSGELTEARIDTSVRRVLALKQRRGLLADPTVDVGAAERVVGRTAHLRIAQAVTDRTVTAVRNDAGLLPLAPVPRSVLVAGWNSATARNVPVLAERLAARGTRSTALPTGLPSDAAIAEATAAARAHDLTVVLTRRADPAGDPGGRQRRLVAALLGTGRPVIVVAVGEPYDIAYLPGVGTYLATYGTAPVSMEALARVLLGERPPSGRLPVTIPPADDPEGVLYPYGHGLSW
ncbi:beta-N-acetylhexosaminidase [Krasilnikovia cinnamomea]|uniref:beta-N-acetylhexosaminidase n=1 Tax=Krasilnikovia cinnamomea TaxID=349313 RepID=A0A4Q7ZSX4_9ACTN|nr:glycoside hydrolase family 3 protein [Krasilnikovia cinnamomea]RZU53743.1 beta-N-acetylhexosaminidase [Krasilnikovia cinnamomea]